MLFTTTFPLKRKCCAAAVKSTFTLQFIHMLTTLDQISNETPTQYEH